MNITVFPDRDQGNNLAAQVLSGWLTSPATRNVMVAAGNTPLELYRRIAERDLKLSHLNVFALDEYVGVPPGEPRNCANLLRGSVGEAWRIPPAQFFFLSPVESEALAGVQAHERRIAEAGGLDVIVLGLGQNGHLGFNEPGSKEDSAGRVVELEPISVEANRQWFAGDYAPAKGVTVGLKTILAARHILIMAYSSHKTAAAAAMIKGPRTARCPASFLQDHPDVRVFLDQAAADRLG
jgi:glucosamine-6-phosphate deaminase